MRFYIVILVLWFSSSTLLHSQTFEGNVLPSTIDVDNSGSLLSFSRKYFKDGHQSLWWRWKKEKAYITFSDKEINESVSSFENRSGIKLWVFNETPLRSSLIFEFADDNGKLQYTFPFNLNFTGWRAVWIAYSDMWTPDGGKTSKQDIVSMTINSPERSFEGGLWLDRLEFAHHLDRRTTPDAQIPNNNRHLDRELWHWGLLYKWEQQEHSIPIPDKVTNNERADLELVYENVKEMVRKKGLSGSEKIQLDHLVERFSISNDANRGAPLMQKDEMLPGDVNYRDLNNLIDLSARAWYADKDEESKAVFLKTVRYMLKQGFAFESGMGTNHHYGYELRDFFGAIWMMEEILRENSLWIETRKAVTYWSGLQETRQPFNKIRDEITDTWNTLLIPRLICAQWGETEAERLRDMQALSRWISGSLHFSPGTIGGIKIDGTIFHHGGHYPAYSVPGLAAVGSYLKCVNNTQFTIDNDAFSSLKFALLSLSRQTNLRDWGLGAAGRHPFNGSINKNGVLTYAYASMVPKETDKELAGEYMRLMEGLRLYSPDNNLHSAFKKERISANSYPKGFYVYNYASQGVYRFKNKMVSLKGFSRNIWGSEIYTNDNRFGRYQSYGAIQIIGTPSPVVVNSGSPVTEESSRYVEEGWDWNRNPGTTTIHLPLELLNSPIKGSEMLRQPNSFSGASSINDGEYGMFAMKLGENERENFTPSFNAYKSVFTFDNRIIALGSGISNNNEAYPTETTLFQQKLSVDDEVIEINGDKIGLFPFFKKTDEEFLILKSITGEHYYIPDGQSVTIERKTQESKENKRMKPTSGSFTSAYINHGKAPKNAGYEYMILLETSRSQISQLKKGETGYEVLNKDNRAHIVFDKISGTRGYAVFENLNDINDEFILNSDAEIMIMLQPNRNQLRVSICDPDLHLGEYSYTTSKESQAVSRMITLKGKYNLGDTTSGVSLRISGDDTEIEVICQHGKPVEFTLNKI